MTPARHTLHRHPDAPWVELRESVQVLDRYRPHSHAQYAVGVVDDGQAVMWHDQGPSWVRAGSVVLIEPDALHACNPVGPHAWSYRMLFVDARWLEARLCPPDAPASRSDQRWMFRSRVTGAPDPSRVLNTLCRPLRTASDVAHLAQALPACLRPWLVAGEAAPPPEASALAPALRLMAEASDTVPRVTDLAAACGWSTGHFIRRFRATFQLSPGQYLLDRRVRAARDLLGQGMALAEAAQAMGFADQAHLQRSFKAHHAMTPGRYAKTRPPLPP